MSAAILKMDDFDGNFDGGAMTVRLFCDATTAIVAGDWIAISPTDTANPGAIAGMTFVAAIVSAATDSANYDVVGVACEALASGTGFINVQVSGHRTGCNVDAAVDAGDILMVGGTKGRAIEHIFDGGTTGNNRRQIGRANTAASSNTSTCEIYRHPLFGG